MHVESNESKKPDSKGVTIYDIAAALNVSASTVSRALSNSMSIKETTRRQIQIKAIEMGYQQNVHAALLGKRVYNTSKEIRIIVPDFDGIGVNKMLAEISTVAEKCGFRLVVADAKEW
jgi:LacI family transcriptional regulator